MYVMFVMVGAGGLMATAQLAPIAKDFKVDGVPVSILGLTLPALDRSRCRSTACSTALTGRSSAGCPTTSAARTRCSSPSCSKASASTRCCYYAADPLLFVILSGLVFFAWGEIYSLFPATCTDIYGRKFATTNYGLLYTAKGTASLLVPLGNVLTTCDRELARGVHHRGDPQHRRRGHGAGCAQADAGEGDGSGLTSGLTVRV